jgi:SAM-dependent methyltransferase
VQSAGEYWRGNNTLAHITPPGERFPEIGLLPILQRVGKGTVFEFGCGDGRLSPAFDASSYIGYDINPAALKAASLNNPEHFYSASILPADTFLANTVLLHVPDNEIDGVVAIAKQYPRIVIGEITGRQWRRGGNPPVFNREAREYAAMIGVDPEVIEVPYPRYACNLSLMVFDGH